MTTTVPTGARPRHGRPRHHESPRARIRARREPRAQAPAPSGAPTAGTQLTSVIEVDLTGVAAEAVLVTVAAAAVRAAAAHPTVVRSGSVHLGVLAEDGTAAAVVEDADDLTPAALAARITTGQRAAAVPTLEVVDTGSRGILMDTPAVGPGRTPVLGIGAVVRRPVVMPADGGEAIVVRAVAHLSLSYDPRDLGGADAARFLHTVRQGIEEGPA